MTATQGSHELPGTLMYAPELVMAPYNSPFRPHRIGPFPVRRIRITADDVWIDTDGGTVRLPPQMVGYSWKP